MLEAALDETYRLPSLARIVGVPDITSLWVAWNDEGLRVRAEVKGVGKARWCQPTRPEDSDGLHLWIATRPTGESHRAGRFCRRLALLPTGGGNATYGLTLCYNTTLTNVLPTLLSLWDSAALLPALTAAGRQRVQDALLSYYF